MEELIQAVERIGLAPAIVVTALLAIAWCGRRLFGEKGLAERALARLSDHLDRSEQLQVRTSSTIDRQLVTCSRMEAIHLDPSGPCNTVSLRRAGAHAVEALGAIGEAVGADVSRHVDAVKRELEQTTGTVVLPPVPRTNETSTGG